jgi:hypothetical protein
MTKRKKGATPRRQSKAVKGLLPGEYVRTKTVTVYHEALDPHLLQRMTVEQREAYHRSEVDAYGRSSEDYLVHTNRLDGVWTFSIKHWGSGQHIEFPETVYKWLTTHVQQIQTAGKKDRAYEKSVKMKTKLDADVDAILEQERARDLGGM